MTGHTTIYFAEPTRGVDFPGDELLNTELEPLPGPYFSFDSESGGGFGYQTALGGVTLFDVPFAVFTTQTPLEPSEFVNEDSVFAVERTFSIDGINNFVYREYSLNEKPASINIDGEASGLNSRDFPADDLPTIRQIFEDSLIGLVSPTLPLTIFGSNEPDLLTSITERVPGDLGDQIHGRGGSDIITGGGGDDLLYGGSFGGFFTDPTEDANKLSDILAGLAGDDTLFGDVGGDRLFGGEGSDQLFGKENDDTLDGGLNNDELFGGAGTDQLIGGLGADILFGGEDNDVAFGGNGSDVFSVERGVAPSNGSNTFYGGSTIRDASDFLNLNTKDIIVYNQPKATFTLRSDPFGIDAGIVLRATHDAGGTDTAFFVEELVD